MDFSNVLKNVGVVSLNRKCNLVFKLKLILVLNPKAYYTKES